MNDETADLIAQLCAREGMIMEDHSPLALTISGMHDRERAEALKQLDRATIRMEVLISAAIALSG